MSYLIGYAANSVVYPGGAQGALAPPSEFGLTSWTDDHDDETATNHDSNIHA